MYYLEFIHQKTGESLKFVLDQIKPLPKVSIAFFDSKEPYIDTRVDMKCIALNSDKGKNKPRAVLEVHLDD